MSKLEAELPDAKKTVLGLYITSKEAYEEWKVDPDRVKIIDVRTPEEYIFVGVEGDKVKDPENVFCGKRMKNGWKNSAPWVYGFDPEKIILEEGAAKPVQ